MLRRTLLASLAAAAATPLPAWAQLAPDKRDDTTLPGLRRDVLIRWGDRVEFDSPPFAPEHLTRQACATQFGWDATVLGVTIPPQAADGIARGVLAVAHPTAEARMMFPGGLDRPSLAAAAQGASLLNLEQRAGRFVVIDGGYQSRRLTASTLCRLTGPAVAAVGDAVQGVLAVQSGCTTPWGTLLLAEGDATPWFDRLPAGDPSLPNRSRAGAFGWMVELDPLDPQSVPAKRTALGRFARGGAVATTSADGRAVVFMTDDRDDGFLFRFVSAGPAAPNTPALLDTGTLSVAVPAADWQIRFAPLPQGTVSLTAARDAARQLGAQRFDRPAGLAIGADSTLFLACRGVALRARPDRLNPRAANPHGHVLLFRPDGRDAAAAVLAGEIAILGGPGGDGQPWLSRPAAIAVGGDGGLWIATDASGTVRAEAATYAVQRAYEPPLGSAMGGVAFTPDGRSVLTAVRHPGDTPGASFDRPATRWPTLRPDMPPQSTVIGLSYERA
jgi:secreted PhoX family phosphatase